ncbi:MAG: trehalose-6-phosphate synthase [Prosthecobacter sp.]|uniref:alpha,alpha-trehalose-phosphate synthase (UDP-forming) n=1 Tax=Prosthecobacter sp. TaxID=1965333 RepID=UPI003BAF3EF1
MVSNREPFIHRKRPDGTVECIRPASGMATALHPIMMASGGTWVAQGAGDADRDTVDANDCVMVPPEAPGYRLRRVWLDPEVERGFYYGLSNEGLWPLCHITFTRPEFRPQDWLAYKEANRIFAEAVLKEADGGKALVFIQDYHFCLLPRMLREMSGGRIVSAHFWHIPWPNREVFRAFPWGEELLDGLLGNDLLGFHIHYHCQNFLGTVDRALEARVDTDRSEITRGGHLTRVRPFPISIDFEADNKLATSPEVAAAMQRWLQRLPGLKGRKIGASIERLDYSKGIPQRIHGLEHFFEQHPESLGKLCFVQIAVPSRDHLASYQAEQAAVDFAVARINERFGTSDWQPVYLLKEHHGPLDMMALHRLADFFMVNSLHDGMNLVAKEFVASRSDERGVLILSLFTGASRELTQAISINPYAIEEISVAVHNALTMSAGRQQRRMRLMREQVAHQNVYRWASRLLMAMLRIEHPDDEDDDELLEQQPFEDA